MIWRQYAEYKELPPLALSLRGRLLFYTDFQ